jgi:hypothetical protein
MNITFSRAAFAGILLEQTFVMYPYANSFAIITGWYRLAPPPA